MIWLPFKRRAEVRSEPERAPTPGEARTEYITCRSCGVSRHIPERHGERGPQLCNACGATLVEAEPGYRPVAFSSTAS